MQMASRAAVAIPPDGCNIRRAAKQRESEEKNLAKTERDAAGRSRVQPVLPPKPTASRKNAKQSKQTKCKSDVQSLLITSNMCVRIRAIRSANGSERNWAGGKSAPGACVPTRPVCSDEIWQRRNCCSLTDGSEFSRRDHLRFVGHTSNTPRREP